MSEENSINQKPKSEYMSYFEDDLKALDEEIKKTAEYAGIIDKEISKFTNVDSPAGGSRGGQHYLIEHIKNAVELSSKKQSLMKDKFNIKKTILDYEKKSETGGGLENAMEELNKLIKSEQERQAKYNTTPVNQQISSEKSEDEIDAELERKIKEAEGK